MTRALVAGTFDYASTTTDEKGRLIALAGQAKKAKGKLAVDCLEMGEVIAEAHSILAKPGRDGRFSAWVESECGISRTSAYQFLHIYQRFANCATVAQFDPGAMRLLAPPSVPDEAVKEAFKISGKGEQVTQAKAEAIVKKVETAKKLVERLANPATAEVVTISMTDEDHCPQGGEHDYDAEACTKCHEPFDPGPQRGPASVAQIEAQTKQASRELGEKTYVQIKDLFGKMVRLIGEYHLACPNEAMREAVTDSLQVAFDDIKAWRRVVSK